MYWILSFQTEGRGNGLPRQPLMMSKERDTNNGDFDVTEEKIRRLPAGGESWDKKMKRKRSVGAVSSRPIDGDGEPKRTAHHKSSGEPGLQSSDPQSYRYLVIFNKTFEFKCLHLRSPLFVIIITGLELILLLVALAR